MTDTIIHRQRGLHNGSANIEGYTQPAWRTAAESQANDMGWTAPPPFSWCEPRPESLIGTSENPPVPGFFKGWPSLSDKIELEEILLFWPTGGITLRPRDQQHTWLFAWSEEQWDGGKEMNGIQKIEHTVYPRSRNNFKTQYGITGIYSDPLFPESDDKSEDYKITLVEYMHQGRRIAWTLKEI